MLRRYKSIIFVLVVMLLTGCATIQPQVVDQTGREIPSPHYVLTGTDYPIAVLFYYSANEHIIDADGTVINKPKYLDFFSHHDIFAEKVKAITLTIEVKNPYGIEYTLYKHERIEMRNVGEVQTGETLNSSKLPYRQFVYELPYGQDIKDVEHRVVLMVDNHEILKIGDFRYHLIF